MKAKMNVNREGNKSGRMIPPLMLMTERVNDRASPHYAPREKSIRARESLRKNDGMEVMTVGPTPTNSGEKREERDCCPLLGGRRMLPKEKWGSDPICEPTQHFELRYKTPYL